MDVLDIERQSFTDTSTHLLIVKFERTSGEWSVQQLLGANQPVPTSKGSLWGYQNMVSSGTFVLFVCLSWFVVVFGECNLIGDKVRGADIRL